MKSRLPKSLLQKYLIALAGVWIVFMAITGLLYGLVLSPQSAQLQKLQQLTRSSAEDYELAQQARRPETKRRIQEQLENTIQHIGQFMVSGEAASRLTVLISQLAAQSNLNEFSVKTREIAPTLSQEDAAKVGEVWLELTFDAPFNRCAAYLNALERNNPIIFIESATIQKSSQASEEPAARILISYLIDKQQTAAATGQNPPVFAANP